MIEVLKSKFEKISFDLQKKRCSLIVDATKQFVLYKI